MTSTIAQPRNENDIMPLDPADEDEVDDDEVDA